MNILKYFKNLFKTEIKPDTVWINKNYRKLDDDVYAELVLVRSVTETDKGVLVSISKTNPQALFDASLDEFYTATITFKESTFKSMFEYLGENCDEF